MGKIPYLGLIDLFQRMYEEHWEYVWGAAKTGMVDCSGAFVWAYGQYGEKIAHGSNAIARQYVTGMCDRTYAEPGMAAFKRKSPGDAGYDLPEKYREGGADYTGDLNDYYHIGLVDESGKYVLNAQSTAAGFTRTPIEKWGAVARLKAVEYGNGIQTDKHSTENESPSEGKSEGSVKVVIPVTNAKVVTGNGLGVNFRQKPSVAALAYGKIPEGAYVNVLESLGDWCKVEYNGKTGYVMTEFLQIQGGASADGSVTVTIPLSVAQEFSLALMKAIGEASGGVG